MHISRPLCAKRMPAAETRNSAAVVHCIFTTRFAPNPFHGKQNVHVRARARSNASPSHTRALERAILALPVAGEYYFQDGNCALPSRFSSKLQSSFNFFPLEITEKGTFDLTIDNWKYNSIIVRKDEPSLTILIQSSRNARENVSTHARSGGSIELHLSQHFGETRSPPT